MREPPTSSSRSWRKVRRAVILLAGASAACTGTDLERAERGRASAGLPAGAIEVGPDLYQVPVGADDGCPMFRLHSPRGLVPQVISYRAVGGGFTTDRSEADCPPPR